MFTSFAIILATASLAAASSIPSKPPYPFPPPYSPARNDGIHLAISAASNCASPRIDFAAANVTSNINVGLKDFHHYSTIITFGDSYTTDGKHDGSTPKPAVVIPPNPEAGGRATNGLTWIENIADDFNSTLKDYAVRVRVSMQYLMLNLTFVFSYIRLEVRWYVAKLVSIIFSLSYFEY